MEDDDISHHHYKSNKYDNIVATIINLVTLSKTKSVNHYSLKVLFLASIITITVRFLPAKANYCHGNY